MKEQLKELKQQNKEEQNKVKVDKFHLVLAIVIVGLMFYAFWPREKPDPIDNYVDDSKKIIELYQDSLKSQRVITDDLITQNKVKDSIIANKKTQIEYVEKEIIKEVEFVNSLNAAESFSYFSGWINDTIGHN